MINMKVNYVTWLSCLIGLILGCSSGSEDPAGGGGGTPEIFISNDRVPEGTSTIRTADVRFNLSAATDKPVTLTYTTVDKSAVAGEDYTTTAGTISFAAGETQITESIPLTNDDQLEFDESFLIQVSNIQNGVMPVPEVPITILDDDTYTPVEDADGFITPTTYPSMELVWGEEFDGSALDGDSWNFELGDGCPNLCGWGNNELQTYTEANTTIASGKMVITAALNAGPPTYTSSRLTTQDKKEFKFGRIDIRAKLPQGQGIWPALWMLGANIDIVGWPTCGEIDIMEAVGHEAFRVHGTAHYNNNGHNFSGAPYSIDVSETFADKYHVFTILWQEGSIQWFVDYQPFYTISASLTGPSYPFNSSFFFIANVAVGGDWPGSPDGTTVFPQVLDVDYIRVFQNPNL